MRRICILVPFACYGQPHVKNPNMADVQTRLIERTLKLERREEQLDTTTLGKATKLSKPVLSAPHRDPHVEVHSLRNAHLRASVHQNSRLLLTATLGRMLRIGNQPHYEGDVTRSRRVRVSAYGVFHNEVANLAALSARSDDLKMALSMLRHVPAEWLAWYDKQAIEFPLATKASTSGVCYAIGDLCAQGVDGKNMSTLDLGRSARSGAAGFVGCGPLAHYYLNFLDKSLSFGGAWWAVLPKIVLEEGPMAVVYNTIYSLLVDAFALRDPRESLRHVQATFMRGFIESIRIMPVVDLVTFTLVPIELQVLWNGVTEILWICIFSTINSEGKSSHGDDELI